MVSAFTTIFMVSNLNFYFLYPQNTRYSIVNFDFTAQDQQRFVHTVKLLFLNGHFLVQDT